MSNIIYPAFDPIAGVVRDATWIDDYFGPHQHGVQFDAGGPVYRPDQVEEVEVAAAGEWIADLRSKLAAVEAERDDLMEQAALKRDCHKDMQALMVRNNELFARADAAEAREAQLREAAKPFDALNDMLDTEDAVLGDEEYFYGSAKLGGVTYGDVRKLRRALSQPQSDYRERVRREERERIAKVADECVLIGAETIRALGDSNANG